MTSASLLDIARRMSSLFCPPACLDEHIVANSAGVLRLGRTFEVRLKSAAVAHHFSLYIPVQLTARFTIDVRAISCLDRLNPATLCPRYRSTSVVPLEGNRRNRPRPHFALKEAA